MAERLEDVGVVVIARNEGERLLRCLDSLRGEVRTIVYADSASTDGSVELTRERGIETVVLEVEAERPLNASRGRNAGFRRLLELHPGIEHVFFVDGDCQLVPGFLAAARAELLRDPGLAAVAGRRRELLPEASPFNRVVDCEWNTPPGETDAFGGDVLLRVSALAGTSGYDESMNQGEDPELAFRLRRAGWRILRIEHDMTLHDVALVRHRAWRRRHRRGGYAYAHGAALHWGEPGRYNQRACLSIVVWGLALPLAAFLGFLPTDGRSALLLGFYVLPWWRCRAQRLRRGDAPAHASFYAALITLGKIDEALGLLQCAWALLTGRQTLTVEYKEAFGVGDRRDAA